MSTDEDRPGRRADGPDRDDEHRDPTAPPPLPDEPSEGSTQALGSPTQPFAVPSPPPPPQYDTPTYTQPSYGLPSYDAPPPPAPYPYGTPQAGPTPPTPSTPPAHPGAAAPTPGIPAPSPSNPYGTPPPPPGAGVPGSPYATPQPYRSPPSTTNAIVLTALSALAVVSCCNVLAIPSLVLGIMGISRTGSDPASAQRLTRIGWWLFAGSVVVVVLAVAAFFALGLSGALDDPGYGDGTTDPFDGY